MKCTLFLSANSSFADDAIPGLRVCAYLKTCYHPPRGNMRIGIISDIHANVVALETVLKTLGPVDRIWCLGDVVGYGPNPNESIATLLAQPGMEICLTGNHD